MLWHFIFENMRGRSCSDTDIAMPVWGVGACEQEQQTLIQNSGICIHMWSASPWQRGSTESRRKQLEAVSLWELEDVSPSCSQQGRQLPLHYHLHPWGNHSDLCGFDWRKDLREDTGMPVWFWTCQSVSLQAVLVQSVTPTSKREGWFF